MAIPPALQHALQSYVRDTATSALILLAPNAGRTVLIGSAANIVASIRSAVDTALRLFCGDLNCNSAFNTLPQEIQCIIFSRLSFTDRVAVSHVCRAWRDTALDEPSLWSNITLSRPAVATLENLLARCKTAPVQLQLLCVDGDELCASVVAHMSHMRSLTIVLYRAEWRLWMHALTEPAPQLVALHVAAGHPGVWNVGETNHLHPDLFAGQAPALREVALAGVALPRQRCPALADVSTLRYTGQICPQDITNMLSHCAVVDSLVLHRWRSRVAWSASTDIACTKPPRSLTLTGAWDPGQLPTVLPLLSHESIPEVNLRILDWPPPADHLTVLLGNTSRIERLSLTLTGDAVLVELVDEKMFTRRTHLDRVDARRVLEDAAIFSGLSSLTIPECLWPTVASMPPAPLLHTLSVHMTSLAQHDAAGVQFFPDDEFADGTGIFQLSTQAPSMRWACPSLRNICIHCDAPPEPRSQSAWYHPQFDNFTGRVRRPHSSPMPSGPLLIAEQDLIDFIDMHLDFGPQLLQEVSLCGVGLVACPSEASWIALKRRAAAVSVAAGRPASVTSCFAEPFPPASAYYI